MNSNENLTINLDKWFSPARMSTYAHHPDPESLYLWNTRVTKAFLEDLQHVEVLLRNCVDAAVAPRYGPRWYTHPAIPFEKPAERAIKKQNAVPAHEESKPHRRGGLSLNSASISGPTCSPKPTPLLSGRWFVKIWSAHRHLPLAEASLMSLLPALTSSEVKLVWSTTCVTGAPIMSRLSKRTCRTKTITSIERSRL